MHFECRSPTVFVGNVEETLTLPHNGHSIVKVKHPHREAISSSAIYLPEKKIDLFCDRVK